MSLTRWLRSAFAAPSVRKLSRACRLSVEALETRENPSGGLLDPTFGSGGIVTHAVTAGNDRLLDVAIQPDGKVVTAGWTNTSTGGSDFIVTRRNANGTADTTFGNAGTVIFNISTFDSAQAVAVLPGGKILVAGTTNARKGFSDRNDFAVVRFNANGTPDATFGTDKKRTGVVVTDLGSTGDVVTDLLVQPDGKIVVSGMSTARGYQSHALVRYNTNGTLDGTFGTGGKQVTTIATGDQTAEIALDGSGRIVLGGRSYPPGVPQDFLLARFLPNGQLDSSFGSGGIVSTDFTGGNDRLCAIAIQADGKIVAAGQSERPEIGRYASAALARYNSDGTLDGTFGQGGLAIGTPDPDQTPGSDPSTDFALIANAMAVQSDSKILIGGRGGYRPEYGPTNAFVLMRFNPDGTTDLDYGPAGNGAVLTPIGVYAEATAIAVQSDGKIVVAGFAESSGQLDFALARFLPSGPQVGTFVGPDGPVAAGDPVTLTAGNITNGNPGATVTQVAFYADANGDGKLDANDTLLGYGTSNGDGMWSLTYSTAGWAAGTYSLLAQATDSYGAPGDPVSLILELV